MQQDVAWFEVAVNDPGQMGRVHGRRKHGDEFRRHTPRQRSACQSAVEATPFAELHAEERLADLLADFVDLHDTGVPHAGDGLRLGAEALEILFAGVFTRRVPCAAPEPPSR